MKKVIIVHGWGFAPDHNWYPWLAEKLQGEDFEVLVPEMPETETPHIESWVAKLAEVSGEIDEDTYFVGHSIGCQTIMRFLAGQDKKCGGFYFVGPWLSLNKDKIQEGIAEYGQIVKDISDMWQNTPIDFERVVANAQIREVFLSIDDYYVPLDENKRLFEERASCNVTVLGDKGHFTKDDGVTEISELLEKIIS